MDLMNKEEIFLNAVNCKAASMGIKVNIDFDTHTIDFTDATPEQEVEFALWLDENFGDYIC